MSTPCPNVTGTGRDPTMAPPFNSTFSTPPSTPELESSPFDTSKPPDDDGLDSPGEDSKGINDATKTSGNSIKNSVVDMTVIPENAGESPGSDGSLKGSNSSSSGRLSFHNASSCESTDQEMTPPWSDKNKRGVMAKDVKTKQMAIIAVARPPSGPSTTRRLALATSNPLGNNWQKYMVDVTELYAKNFKMWEFGDAEKCVIGTKGEEKPGWRCLFCLQEFVGANHTKAIAHFAHIPNTNISACPKVPEEGKNFYEKIHGYRQWEIQKKRAAKTQASVSDMESKRQRTSRAVSSSTNSSLTTSTSAERALNIASRIQGHIPQQVDFTGDSDVFEVMTRPGVESANEKATDAFCNMIIGNRLSLNLGDSKSMNKFLQVARHVGSSYTLPSADDFCLELLGKAAAAHRAKVRDIVDGRKQDAGFTIVLHISIQDGKPLLLVLVRVPGHPPHVMQVVDCTEAMQHPDEGNTVMFFSNILHKILENLDPTREFLDLIIYDNESEYLERAAELIKMSYHRVTIMPSVEHVISKIFRDILQTPPLQFMMHLLKATYYVFGSGSNQVTHALFMEQARRYNGNRTINLMCAVDTPIGCVFSLMRMFRMKDSLIATLHTEGFQKAKIRGRLLKTVLCQILSDLEIWNQLYLVLRCLFPLCQLLVLADSDAPAMELLHFYLRKAREAMDLSEEHMNASEFQEVIPRPLQELNDIHPESVFPMISDKENSCSDFSLEKKTLHLFIKDSFDKHTNILDSPLSITAYALSVDPDVIEHKNLHLTQWHFKMIDKYIETAFPEVRGPDLGAIKVAMREEIEDHLHSQSLPVHARPLGYKPNENIKTLFDFARIFKKRTTRFLGLVACRIGSKDIGNGGAHLCLKTIGDVKQGQTCSMSTEAISNLGILQGQAVIETKLSSAQESARRNVFDWDRNDTDVPMLLERFGGNPKADGSSEPEIFRAFVEEFEVGLRERNDPVSCMKLTKKYCRRTFFDLDDNKLYRTKSSLTYISKAAAREQAKEEKKEYNRRHPKGPPMPHSPLEWGWAVELESMSENDEEPNFVYFVQSEPFFDCMVESYKQGLTASTLVFESPEAERIYRTANPDVTMD